MTKKTENPWITIAEERTGDVAWKDDFVTRQWRKKNADELSKPLTEMSVRFLADAMTYISTLDNVFTREFLFRAGLLDKFADAFPASRSRIVAEAGKRFGVCFV